MDFGDEVFSVETVVGNTALLTKSRALLIEYVARFFEYRAFMKGSMALLIGSRTPLIEHMAH